VALATDTTNDYDAVIVAVNHEEYKKLVEQDFKKFMKDDSGVFVDVKGIFKGKIHTMEYWSL